MPASLRIAAALGAALLLAGCAVAAGPGSAAPDPSTAEPATPSGELGVLPEPIPTGEVLAQGTVLDDGDGPELCLGGVAESYPPQCSGPAIDGWDWTTIDGWEEASGVRWGAYAVQGTYDGERFAVTTTPILLALYDPAPVETEALDSGTTPEDELVDIQYVLVDALGDRQLGSTVQDGRLVQLVVFDDGTLQEHLDGVYGPHVVQVVSALVPVDG